MYCIGFVVSGCENGAEVCKLGLYFLVEMYSTKTMSSKTAPLLSALPPLLQCQGNFMFLLPEITKASGWGGWNIFFPPHLNKQYFCNLFLEKNWTVFIGTGWKCYLSCTRGTDNFYLDRKWSPPKHQEQDFYNKRQQGILN